MKKPLLVLLALLGTLLGHSQSYFYVQSTGTSSPYTYNQSGTSILTSGNEVLSTWQTLPFSWNFYGVAVTGYYASDNGYITFDNSAASSVASNTALPNAGGPNNAIYAFWDDFTVDAASGNPDVVRTWTYGTAPNRVHCIQWWSMTPTGSTTWVYTTIRLYEGGDFDIVQDYSASTAGASTSGTIGCEDATGTDGTMVTGSPSIQFGTFTTAGTDDRVYSFTYGSQNTYDVGVSALGLSGTVNIGNNSITGTVQNFGSQAVSSVTVTYQVDAGTPVAYTFTGLNIAASGGTYNFTHPTPYNFATGGQVYNLSVWTSNPNSSTDQDLSNDTASVSLLANNGVSATKNAMIEEFTGAWCQFCPDGVVVLDGIETAHPDNVVIVSVHDGDAMEFAEGIRSAFSVSSYPSANIDRWHFAGETKVPCSRGTWSNYTTQRLSAYTPASVTVTSSYNAGTRQVDATVTTDFVDYAAGDLRIGFMVVEDSVTGTGTGYNQVNYYNTQSGHPYYGAGNPIVGFVHRHVLRDVPSTWAGTSGVIPATVNPGASYSQNYSVTLPAAWDDSRIHLVGFLYQYETDVLNGEILNVDESPLGEAVSIGDPTLVSEGIQNLFPNPVQGLGNVEFVFAENTVASVEIWNSLGQKVSVLKEGGFSAGSHRVWFDASEVPNGAYFLTVRSERGVWTRKVMVAH